MRNNPNLPMSSVMEDNAEDVARDVLGMIMSRVDSLGSGYSIKISRVIGDGEFVNVSDPIRYESSSGVSGTVFFVVYSDSMKDRNVVGGAVSKVVDGEFISRIKIAINKKMSARELGSPEFNEELLKVIVHELGHVIDKNTRYSVGSRVVKKRGGLLSYVNSRVEVQAEAQAAYFFLKRYAEISGSRIPAKDLERHIFDYLPYHISKRYNMYTDQSKRVFLLYVYNALGRDGLVS